MAIVLFIVSGNTIVAQNLQSGTLRAGAAKKTMNPPTEMLQSGPEFRRFSGVHDNLYARTIVIDNGLSRVAMVSLDISKAPGGALFIKEIAEATGIKEEYLYISATHDHNTIQVPSDDNSSEYYTIIKEAVVGSIKEAESKLQEAQVGYAEGKAYVNTNRDEKIGEGYHMGYVPEGVSDKTVTVVSFTSMTGEPIAIYANYPVHGVVMYRATTKDGLPEITGDLPGATSNYVEDRLNGAITLWTSGAAGDQNPLFMATYNQDHPDVFDEGPGGYAILDVQARRLGEEIVRLTKSIKNTSSKVKIWGKKTTVTCPGRERKYPRDPNVPRGGYLAPSKIEMVDGDPVTIPLHLLMINDIALSGVSAEVFTEIGMHLKEQSIFDRTMMVTVMANSIGYVPTDAAYLMPSEKAISNVLKPGCAEPTMINAFLELMDEYLSVAKD